MDIELGTPAQGKSKKDKNLTQKDDGVVRCVFSSSEKAKIGAGVTARTTVSKTFWYAEQVEGEGFRMREINSNHVPFGEEAVLSLKELLDDFLPEIEYWERKTLPAMEQLESYLEEGEIDLEDGKYSSAEESFGKALELEEKNIRGLFNLGLVYFETEKLDEARNLLGELLNLKAPFEGKNQHLFNRFGISLRKSGLYDDAVGYFNRALEFIDDDEHLFYNLARIHFERGDWPQCVSALVSCHGLNHDLPAARNLAQLVMNLAEDRRLCQRNRKPFVPVELVEALAGILQSDDMQDSDLGEISMPEKGRVRGSGSTDADDKYNLKF